MIHNVNNLSRNNDFNEIMKILDNAEYLTEQESIYYPEMVPIRESNELGKYIIRLEDFVEYSMSNGINDGGYALSQICESSQVNQDDIVFSVNEVSVLEDPDMEDTVRKLLETGFQVYSVPISDKDMVYLITEAVIKAMVETYGTTEEEYANQLYTAYINDDFSYLNEEYIMESIQDSISNIKNNAQQSIQDTANRVGNAISQSVDNSKKWTAKKISSLKKLGGEVGEQINNGGKQIVNNINNGIGHLKSKLKN